ncbi:MAG: sigma-70 family RNA polymerase sigma factor [Bacteroides thetaiotaomicron]
MDEKLILTALEQAAAGDDQACLQLIQKYKPLLLSMGKRYNYENLPSEDLIAEGISVLLLTINDFDPFLKISYGAYLKKQLFYHWVEKAKRFRYVSSLQAVEIDSQGLSLLERLADPSVLIENDYIGGELIIVLNGLLTNLRPRQIWLLNEYYSRGRSLKDLAAEIGCSANALSQLHRRLLNQLRAGLLAAGFDRRLQ